MPDSLNVQVPFNGYNNFVLAEQIKSSLDTKLDISRFVTPDYQLSENPGMTKKIHKYTITAGSAVDDLGRLEGNSNFIDAEFGEEEYTVARTQGQIRFADEDLMNDPTLIDAKVRFLSESMVNDWNRKAIAEWGKTSNIYECTGYDLENFANAISKYTSVYEDMTGLFFVCNQGLDAKLRKMLGDELKYVEAYIKTGAIGTVLGVPVYLSKAIPAGIIYLATREAVTAFVKREVGIEQDHDIDTKLNRIVATRYNVIALTDETKCIAFGEGQSTAVSITAPAAEDVAIEGAGTNGATVVAYVNGVKAGSATVSSGAYSIGYTDGLVAGDIVKVVASVPGKVNSIATATVA